MKPPIGIALWDTDCFFLQGIQHILKDYFYQKGDSVVFIPTAGVYLTDLSMADLVVKREIAWGQRGYERHKIVIARSYVLNERKTFCLQGAVNRSEKPEAVVRLLDDLFDPSARPLPGNSATSPIRISAREHEILRYIAAELTPHQIAKRLNISIKTVSTHKGTAMRKLGFTRKNDLYNWLLLSGVTTGLWL
ncbi:helix-turn-helix transcriptional regulator [Serratia fonticola]|uniref:helix-turn-helix transcriptional regulator n=1 Tax=Serratia fonticola TaxID=47917 RepID=UPI0015C60366|nr:LuxR C-terminal-related transcriptional regulator [Serratia fonticola]MBC3379043.1 helix-turn-helix transcriptional regulator [Serratia fonticola]NYA38243.1 helix-turn-helix transcriptional regulator [Serratia fonticola]